MATNFNDEASDQILSIDGGIENSLGLMESECAEPAPDERTGPTCEKCQAPLMSDVVTVCRSCGWYPSLGIFVEVDPHWEAADKTGGSTDAAPQPSHLQVWLNLLPRWAWLIIASMTAVVIESIVARLATPAEVGGLRTMWSLTQLGVGLFALILCHIFNFLTLVAEDSDVGFLDVLLKPLKLWIRTAQRLPERLWLVNTAACSLTAAVMSVVVIGALPYERLWDWGFEAPVKQNLMGAVMDRAKKLDSRNGADNLEDAIGDFAGSQDLEPGGLPKATPEKPRKKADCVILGYQTDRDGRLDAIVLGTEHLGKLVFAGKVRPEMSETELRELLDDLTSIKTRTPFLAMQSDSAVWVQPKYACRVTYGEKTRGGQLREMKWDSLAGAMRGKQ